MLHRTSHAGRRAAPALIGFVVAAWLVVSGFQMGLLRFPGQDVVKFFAPAGEAFRSGGDPYALTADGTPFFYAPPWAAAFAVLPSAYAITIAVYAANLAALRYMAGSWLAVGCLCLFPLVPWSAATGTLNIVTAAAIVAACRGVAWPGVVMGLAKVSPAFAIAPRSLRTAVLVLLACCALTLPRLDLWLPWIERLGWGLSHQVGPLVPVPFVWRLPVGLALVAWRRPWSVALGAVIATPGFYWESLVLFVAPVVVLLRGRNTPQAAAPVAGSGT